jgi:hypothetical protein
MITLQKNTGRQIIILRIVACGSETKFFLALKKEYSLRLSSKRLARQFPGEAKKNNEKFRKAILGMRFVPRTSQTWSMNDVGEVCDYNNNMQHKISF